MESKSTTPFIIGMRDSFFDALYEIFKQDKNSIFITADNGSPRLDQFATEMPEQYYTVGIAEQQLMGLAAGLAVEGRKVYTYAIAPFNTLRCIEFIKLDQCAMNVPIVNIGIGAGYSYDIMGPTHHAVEDIAIMRTMPNLKIWSPSDSLMAKQLAFYVHADNAPHYIRFDRSGIPDLYNENKIIDFESGMIETRKGSDLTILSTGRFVYQSLQVANKLKESGISAQVIDVFRLKPFNYTNFLSLTHEIGIKPVVIYEEHYLAGGLSSIFLETRNDWYSNVINDLQRVHLETILRIGAPDKFTFTLGGRQEIWNLYELDINSVTERIKNFLGKKI